MKKPPYRQVFTLQTPLENVECWNKTGPERYTLPIGTLLLIEHAYDSTRTTCMAQERDLPGIAKELFPGAYRFIIENQALGAAIGHKMPKRTADLIGDIIAYENGEASPAAIKRLFKNPVCRKLQGHYSSRCTA